MKVSLTLSLLALVLSFATEGCSQNKSANLPQRSKTVVLQYEDFGPQIMSYEYIGMGWYQWDSSGGGDPNRKFDIRVVVYRNISLDEVKQKFPVIEGKQDYRYLEYVRALELFKQYEAPHWDELPVTKEAKNKALQIKQRILQELGT